MTGLLTRNFTLYYGLSDLLGDPIFNDINGTLGTVNIKDPIHTLQVRFMHVNIHTYFFSMPYRVYIIFSHCKAEIM